MKVHHHTILCCGNTPLELQDEDGINHTIHPYWSRFESWGHIGIHNQIKHYIESFDRYFNNQKRDICCVLVRWDNGLWSVWCGYGKAPKVLN